MANWTEIANSPKFQGLSSKDREAVRDDFFTRVISPKIPPGDLEAVRADFYAKSQPKLVAPEKSKTSGLLNRGGVVDGLIKGLRDPLDAAAQLLNHAVPEGARRRIDELNNYLADKTGLVGRLPEGGLDQRLSQQEQEYQAARQAEGRSGIDAARLVGNIGASIPLTAAPGLQLATGKGIFDAANIARGAGQSALLGALQPVTEGDFGKEKLKQIETSALLGGVMTPIGAAASRVIAPKTSDEIKLLMKEGVTPTPGQILGGMVNRIENKLNPEGRARSIKDFNRAAYARALEGTGIDAKTLPVGREGIAAVRKAVKNQYETLLPKLVWKPDHQFYSEIKKIEQMASGLGAQEQQRFTRVINNIMSKSRNGTMLGETYKSIESKLSKDMKNFSSSTDAYQRDVGDALGAVLQSMKDALARSNPAQAKQLAQANRNYANYVILRNAGRGTGDMAEGFTPHMLSSAVKASDSSVGDGAFASGRALMQDLSDAGVHSLAAKSSAANADTIKALLMGGLGAGAYANTNDSLDDNNPLVLLSGLAAMGLYSKGGQRAAAALLTKRPQGAQEIGNALLRLAPLAGGALSGN